MKNILIISLFIILSSCSESIKPIDTAVQDQILYIGNGTEPQDLDPHIVTGVPESKVLMALLETEVNIDYMYSFIIRSMGDRL